MESRDVGPSKVPSHTHTPQSLNQLLAEEKAVTDDRYIFLSIILFCWFLYFFRWLLRFCLLYCWWLDGASFPWWLLSLLFSSLLPTHHPADPFPLCAKVGGPGATVRVQTTMKGGSCRASVERADLNSRIVRRSEKTDKRDWNWWRDVRIKAPEELRRKLNEIGSSLNLFSSHRVGNFAPTAPSLNTSVPSPKSPLTSEPFLCFVVPFVSEEKKRKSGSIHGRRRLLVRYFLSKYFLKITALLFYSFAIPWFVCISDKFISFRTDASLVQLFDWLTRILLSCQLPERRRDFIFFIFFVLHLGRNKRLIRRSQNGLMEASPFPTPLPIIPGIEPLAKCRRMCMYVELIYNTKVGRYTTTKTTVTSVQFVCERENGPEYGKQFKCFVFPQSFRGARAPIGL